MYIRFLYINLMYLREFNNNINGRPREGNIVKTVLLYVYLINENAFKIFIHMDIHSVILDCFEAVSVHIYYMDVAKVKNRQSIANETPKEKNWTIPNATIHDAQRPGSVVTLCRVELWVSLA